MGKAARKAAAVLARTPTAVKAEALRAAARAIRAGEAALLAANASDMARGEANGLTGALLDRLTLDPKRLDGVAAGRSEERRVGKGCVSTAGSTWPPDPQKTKHSRPLFTHMYTILLFYTHISI